MRISSFKFDVGYGVKTLKTQPHGGGAVRRSALRLRTGRVRRDIPLRTRYIALYRSVKTVGGCQHRLASRDPTAYPARRALRLTARTVGLKHRFRGRFTPRSYTQHGAWRFPVKSRSFAYPP